jgi:DNA-binding LacI/PurR family transcriptional regulator
LDIVKKITIYDVAKKAGCSSATVSLVLKDDKRVKIETREKVIEVMKELKYKPNYFARGLVNQKTNSLGLIVPDLKNPIFSDIIEGAEQYVSSKGYHLIVGVTNLDKEKEMLYLNMLREKKIDGLIILPTFIEDIKKELVRFKRENFPFVLSGVSLDDINVNYVSCNMEEGAYLAVSHLIEQGHTSIAFISGVANENQSNQRLIGYKKALAENGIPFQEDNYICCGPSISEAYEATRKLIKSKKDVTGMFCLYDYLAMGVMKAIIDEGLKIPDDYAVAGYDNVEIAQYMPVPLTTIETHNKKVGETAAKVLIEQIEGSMCEFQHIVMSPKLVIRDSTARKDL